MASDILRDPDGMASELRFLAGGGEATRLILARDWSGHLLGPPARWPDILKSNLSIVLNSPESMILAWGADELTLFFNERYFPLLGPRLSWAMGASFKTVWADAWAQAKPIIDEAFAGRSQRFDDLPWKLNTDRGAADTWFTFSYSRILDPQGEIAGLFIFTNETTERVLADAALKRSEERLRLVVEGARDHVIFTTDPDGIITAWYAGAEAVLGWSPGEAVGQPAAMIFTEEDRADGVDFGELARAARDGCAADERWHLKKDGSRAFLNGSVHLLPAGPQGEARGFIKIARDDTQRREAEFALRRSEAAALVDAQRVQLALAAGAIIGTWVWDLPSDRFTVDEAFARAFGLDPELGRDGLSLAQIVATVHPEDQAGLAQAIEEAIARGGAYAHQYRTLRTDGQYRWLEANGRVDHAPDGTPLSFPGVLIDVAERRKLAEERDRALTDLRALNETLEQRVAERTAELMRTEEALRQAQKMEAVGQLTGGLAHDFNNLLTGMMGNLELLQARLARGRLEDMNRFIDAAQGAGRRAASLTQRLLAFSRRQTLDPKPVDVNRLIAGMEELLRRTVDGTQIDVVGAAGLWAANIDAGQLENALLNLCINARDAMPDGGCITIETANKVLDERAAAKRELPPGHYLSICVTDTGSGMSAETVARAFEPFYTTKPIGQGTGLGLSMIYGFARQSGGQVRISSEIGRGTTVCVYLPRHFGDAEQAETVETARSAASATGQSVLVIDDEPAIRHLIDEVLDEAGYTVINAADGASGLRILESGVQVELLITDVGLPNGMNGRQVADAARALLPGLKVLFITGYAENAAVGNGHLEPGMELLTKPFSMDALAAKVADMIKVGRPI